MKILPVICMLLLLAVLSNSDQAVSEDFFNFRVKILEQFNTVRRILAAGDVAKLYNILSKVLRFVGIKIPADFMGPAANMHKLKWSRRLESIAFEYKERNGTLGDIRESIHYKDHIGFHWMGNILHIFETALDTFKFPRVDKLTENFKEILKYIEVIVMVFWMLASAPYDSPLPKGKHYGPAEAIFAERYEIGCWSDPYLSVCFLDPLPYRKHPFEVGPACTACSTHCEFWEQVDKTIEEGDLCVPPIPHEEKMMKAVTEAMTDAAGTASLALIIISPWIFYCFK